jgi:hypothetical protein
LVTFGRNPGMRELVEVLTGAEIELICHRGWQISANNQLTADNLKQALADFLPDRPPRFLDMINMTLQFTNFKSLLPTAYQRFLLPREQTI